MNSVHTYLYSIKTLHYCSSAVKYTHALLIAFKSRRLVYLTVAAYTCTNRQLLHGCLCLYFLI